MKYEVGYAVIKVDVGRGVIATDMICGDLTSPTRVLHAYVSLLLVIYKVRAVARCSQLKNPFVYSETKRLKTELKRETLPFLQKGCLKLKNSFVSSKTVDS